MDASRKTDSSVIEVLTSNFIASLPSETTVCVGLSGGKDSVALLHALHAHGGVSGRLFAHHVHHGLNPGADAWVRFCSDLCSSWGVPLTWDRVDVCQGSGEGLEAAARKARYSSFSEISADVLVLAHHAGDQIETVLMRILRGTGIDGLSGMSSTRSLRRPKESTHGADILLMRPWLALPPESIVEYVRLHALPYVTDSSNEDVRFSRNFLRHDILPALLSHFPGMQSSLVRLSDIASETSFWIRGEAEKVLVHLSDSVSLDLLKWQMLEPALRRAVLRAFMRRWLELLPSASRLDEMMGQLISSCGQEGDGAAQFDFLPGVFEVWKQRLWFHCPADAMCNTVDINLATGNGLPRLIPWSGKWIRLRSVMGRGLSQQHLTAEGRLYFQSRIGGERLQTNAKRPRRRVKSLLQESRVPPWERNSLPFLWKDNELLWVPGIGYSTEYVCSPGEQGIELDYFTDKT